MPDSKHPKLDHLIYDGMGYRDETTGKVVGSVRPTASTKGHSMPQDDAIPSETQVNGYTIKTDPHLGLSSVSKPGLLVPENKASFNVPQDGDIRQCYDKAVAWAEAN